MCKVKLNNYIQGDANAVRVWRGYRAEGITPDKFVEKLGSIFIPVTVQLLEPLGLLAYFPTYIVSPNKNIPDEIALVFYETQDDYYSISRNTVVGRAYGMLHGNLFNFKKSAKDRSRSSFPESALKGINQGQAYYLIDEKVNWRTGITQCYVGVIDNEDHFKSICKRLNPAIKKINQNQACEHNSIKAAILYCDEHYLLYWENSTEMNSEQSLLPLLRDLTTSLFDDKAKVLTVSNMLEGKDDSIKIEQSVCYSVMLNKVCK